MKVLLTELKEITAAVAAFDAAAGLVAEDRTVSVARQALQDAIAAQERAAGDDDDADPAELVDRRADAARDVEIARLRLDRAERAAIARQRDLVAILKDPATRTSAILRETAPGVSERFIAAAMNLFGPDYLEFKARIESLGYRRGDQLASQARMIESAGSPADRAVAILAGIRMIEAAATA